jgi:hypothetical protein
MKDTVSPLVDELVAAMREGSDADAWNLADELSRPETARLAILKLAARVIEPRSWSSPHPMVGHLIDLESPFQSEADRAYRPEDLLRYALTASEYWAGLALDWLSHGAPTDGMEAALLRLAHDARRSQPLRHRALRLARAIGNRAP